MIYLDPAWLRREYLAWHASIRQAERVLGRWSSTFYDYLQSAEPGPGQPRTGRAGGVFRLDVCR